MKNTNRALLSSVVALILCCSMLIGSTFAWFTDEVNSSVHTIQAGNLDIMLADKNGTELTKPLAFVNKDGSSDILWEPGATFMTEQFQIINAGNLALKYEIIIKGAAGDVELLDVIEFTMGGQTVDLTNTTMTGELLPGASTGLMVLSGHMDENAGNEYKKMKVTDVELLIKATQLTHENDSFNNQYDALAPYPVAKITNADEHENKILHWGSYGPWSPSYPDYQMLESAYVFVAPHDANTIADCEYKDWYCDYVVSLDRDLEMTNGVGDLFLGGNYGSFGWIGFENPKAIPANTEIPLLGSVTTNPWTYEAIATSVGTFTCGVARTYGSDMTKLNGATFTVRLRLTNPETGEFKDVSTVQYTFTDKAADLNTTLSNATGKVINLTSGVDYGTITLGEVKDVVINGAHGVTMILKTDANTKIENLTVKNVGFEYTGATADCGIVIDANAQIKNLVVEGCTFTGTGAKAGRGISGDNNTATLTLKGCTFKDLGYPIYAWGSYAGLTIEGCTFDNIKSWAIMPQSGFNGDLTVNGCKFVDCLGGGLIKAGTLTAGHTFTFTNNEVNGCTIAGDHNWFQFNASAGTVVMSGNTKDDAAWTPGVAEGLK